MWTVWKIRSSRYQAYKKKGMSWCMYFKVYRITTQASEFCFIYVWLTLGMLVIIQFCFQKHCLRYLWNKYFTFCNMCKWTHNGHEVLVFSLEFLISKTMEHVSVKSDQWRALGGGGQTPPPKFRRPSKIVPDSTHLWKLLKIAEFRMPTPQDVRKKGSKILKLPRFTIVLC